MDRIRADIKSGEFTRAANAIRPILRANPRSARTSEFPAEFRHNFKATLPP